MTVSDTILLAGQTSKIITVNEWEKYIHYSLISNSSKKSQLDILFACNSHIYSQSLFSNYWETNSHIYSNFCLVCPLKALANEDTLADTLLPMMFLGLHKLGNICYGHKIFLNKIRNIFCVPDKCCTH